MTRGFCKKQIIFPSGLPKEKNGPIGGSALHAVKSVGVI